MSTATLPAPVADPASTAKCLYCESRDLEVLYTGVRDRLDFVPGERTFLQCRRCGSAVLAPLPQAEDLAAFYPPVYSFTPELGQGPLRRALSKVEYHLFFKRQYRAQVRRVLRAVGHSSGTGRSLLDVGCGRGLRLLEFRKAGFDVCGLDLQPDVVQYLRESLYIPAECGDVLEVPRRFAPASFDVVTTYFLIEHIPDVRAALRGMFEVLKPGGWLVAAIPFIDCVQSRLFGRQWIHTAEAPRHLTLPSQRGIRAACESAGFDQVRIVADSLLNCAGQVGSSLIPGATITHAYGGGRLWSLAARALGGVVTFASIPWCAFENHVLGKPSMGMVLARKPE
jgi:SAM-dependent methyltransferase